MSIYKRNYSNEHSHSSFWEKIYLKIVSSSMANLSSDLQSFTVDDPITQLAELNNTLHQFQTMFAPPFSSSLDSLFFHHHQHQQLPDHFTGKSPENNNFHQGVFIPSNIHNKNDESSLDSKKRKTLMASMSTSENSVSDQTSSAQVSINGNVLTKNVFN